MIAKFSYEHRVEFFETDLAGIVRFGAPLGAVARGRATLVSASGAEDHEAEHLLSLRLRRV